MSGGVLSPNFHAFLWTREKGIQDLGTLPGDFISEAVDINDQGQVVGLSCGAVTCRAFLWQNGAMIDLNTLIPHDSSLYLTSASAIDSHGAITGQACVLTNGQCLSTSEAPAFVAIPVALDENANAAADGNNDVPMVTLPGDMRKKLLQQRGFHHFEAEPVRPQ